MDAVEKTTTGLEFLNELYEASTIAGTTLQFRIFDSQNCEHIGDEWLAGAVEADGITRDELERMINEGLLRRWTSPDGKEGFLLYSEYQARVAKKLRDSGRYSTEELRHIFSDWNSYLEIVMNDELTYDSFNVDDYEHFRRRAAGMVANFEDDLRGMDEPNSFMSPAYVVSHKGEVAKRLQGWKWIHNKVSSCPDSELPPEIQQAWRKELFRLRWVDEFCRVTSADRFSTQIEQGYSVEVAFDSHEWREGVTSLKHINWNSTLKRFKETRNEGKTFPLRTPDFNVTEEGIVFLKLPQPDEYAALHEKYQLGRLSALLEERGATLWECDLAASGRAECPECNTVFERTTSSRKYCGDRCRSRAKSRRYRQTDPERARRAQARYYRDSYPDGSE